MLSADTRWVVRVAAVWTGEEEVVAVEAAGDGWRSVRCTVRLTVVYGGFMKNKMRLLILPFWS